jgi:hypothetical protein
MLLRRRKPGCPTLSITMRALGAASLGADKTSENSCRCRLIGLYTNGETLYVFSNPNQADMT